MDSKRSGIPKFSHHMNGGGETAKATTKNPLEINDQLQRLIEKTAESEFNWIKFFLQCLIKKYFSALEQNSQLEKDNAELKQRIQSLEDQVYFLKIQATRNPPAANRESSNLSEMKLLVKEKDDLLKKFVILIKILLLIMFLMILFNKL